MSESLIMLNTTTPIKIKKQLKIVLPSLEYNIKSTIAINRIFAIDSVQAQNKPTYFSISTDMRFITSGDYYSSIFLSASLLWLLLCS